MTPCGKLSLKQHVLLFIFNAHSVGKVLKCLYILLRIPGILLWQCMLENFKHLLNCSLTAVQASLSVVYFGACLTANNVNDRVVNTRD